MSRVESECRFPNGDNGPRRSSTSSDHSSRNPETKLFHVKFSDLHVPKEDSIKRWCDRLESQLFETEYLTDEDPVLVPADVAAILHPPQKETLRVRELWQLKWPSNGGRVIETRWDLVVHSLMRALVIEPVTKAIEAALLCAKGCRRRFRRILLPPPTSLPSDNSTKTVDVDP
jgi:hypothetical protein